MSKRIDQASRRIAAPPAAVYEAFAEPGALQNWLPPKNMTGALLDFDFRPGGSFRMRLVYNDPENGRGKTSADSDEVAVQILDLVPPGQILWAVTFESDDPGFSGLMRMTWNLEPAEGGSVVTVVAEDVPKGIRPGDHKAGLNSTLDNLARFLQR